MEFHSLFLLDDMFDRFDGSKSCSVVFLGNDLAEKKLIFLLN